MACEAAILAKVPLFATLDEDERAVLTAGAEVKAFAPRQRIYRIGDAGGAAHVIISAAVRLTTVDHDHQEVVVDVRVRAARNANEIIEAEATAGERIADAVAGFGGSWAFIISFLVTLAVYTILNLALGRSAWDPYPFILLNLILSMLAAIQAPVIMMSQNRQDTKDRLRSELDFDVNRRAGMEVQNLSRKLNALSDKLDDIEALVRRGNVEG